VLLWNREKYFHDLGVELSAGAAANLFPCVRHRQGLAVRTIADHGIHRIGKGEYARAEGNLLSTQSAGITGAVEKFLVGKDDLRGIAKKGNLVSML